MHSLYGCLTYSDPLLIGVTTDLHYEMTTYPDQLEDGQMIVSGFNSFELDAVLVLGDIIHDPLNSTVLADNLAIYQPVWDACIHDVYWVVGNHDNRYMTPEAWAEQAPFISDKNYTVDVRGYRFIIYSNAESGDPYVELEYWISAETLAWLEAQMTQAIADGMKTILVNHNPEALKASPGYNHDLEHAAIVAAVAGGLNLLGVFSGHNHQNLATVKDGITYYEFPHGRNGGYTVVEINGSTLTRTTYGDFSTPWL